MNRVVRILVSPLGSVTVQVASYAPGVSAGTLAPLAVSVLAFWKTGAPPDPDAMLTEIGSVSLVDSDSAVNAPYSVSPSIGEVSATSGRFTTVDPPLRSSVCATGVDMPAALPFVGQGVPVSATPTSPAEPLEGSELSGPPQ